MKLHTVTTVDTLSYDQLSFIAFANGLVLQAGQANGRMSVTYGNKRGPELSWIPSCVSIYGPHIEVVDGKPLYIGARDREQFVVHGQTEGRHYDDVSWLIARDGSIGHLAKAGDEHFAVVNGVEGKRYERIWPHAFGHGKMLYDAELEPRDCNLSFREQTKRCRTAMVYGTDESPPYHFVLCDNGMQGRIVDGKPLYAVIHLDGNSSIIYGSQEGKRYQGGIGDLQWADGAPLYTICEPCDGNRRHILVRGDDELACYGYIHHPSWVDGKPLYAAYQDGRNFIMFGSDRLDDDCHIYGPDIASGKLLYIGQYGGYVGDDRERCQFIIHGDWRSERFDHIWSLLMAGDQPIYHAELPSDGYDDDGEPIRRMSVMVADQPGKVYDWIDDLTVAGNQPLYRAHTDDGWCVVVGTDEGHAFDAVFSLEFNSERNEVTYGALKGRVVYRVSVSL